MTDKDYEDEEEGTTAKYARLRMCGDPHPHGWQLCILPKGHEGPHSAGDDEGSE